MSVLKLLQAAYSTGYTNTNGVGGAVAPKGAGANRAKGTSDGIPTFGIKGREPLTQDTFEYKGERGLTKDQVRTKSYNDVYRHEAAHLAAAGKYASSGINIDFDGNGFAVGGHVNVKMPTLNKSNPDETIEHAKTVKKSATAPEAFSDLSDADKSVAAQCDTVLAQAQAYKSQNPFRRT